MIDQFVTA